jgi:hypothetical protein
MTRPIWASIAACLGALVIILAFQARTWLNSEQTKLTVQETREILNRELDVGTDKSRVQQFLRREAWAYSDGGSTIQAMVREASRNRLIRTDIRISFFFDSNGN